MPVNIDVQLVRRTRNTFQFRCVKTILAVCQFFAETIMADHDGGIADVADVLLLSIACVLVMRTVEPVFETEPSTTNTASDLW